MTRWIGIAAIVGGLAAPDATLEQGGAAGVGLGGGAGLSSWDGGDGRDSWVAARGRCAGGATGRGQDGPPAS